MIYQIIKNRWCDRVGRAHKSNGIYISVDINQGLAYQKCHDPDCRGFRSVPTEIPRYALDPLLGGDEMDELLSEIKV